jgi:dTDP-4-amino-4,6-dideoxygalactose transaminase
VGPEYPLTREALYQRLRNHNIYARRYFYPLISDFPMYRGLKSAQKDNLPVATEVAERVICLPMHSGLGTDDVQRICCVLKRGGQSAPL